MKEIPLTNGHFALVDDEDYEALSAHKWYADINPRGVVYARRRIGKTYTRMHNVIMGAKGIDHWDTNGLNNQKANLRKATGTQNQANSHKRPAVIGKSPSSRFKGVMWYKPLSKWRAMIRNGHKRICLGYYPGDESGEVDAAQAYNFKAYELRGEFARLNTPDMPEALRRDLKALGGAA